jgi:hypothetical protein
MSLSPARLPQDALLDRRGVPDLATLRESVEAYIAMRARGISQGDFSARAQGCWGLVAHGSASLGWIDASLAAGDDDAIADAAGILGWIGVPARLAARLRELRSTLPEGEALGVVTHILPADARQSPATPANELLLGGRWEAFASNVWFIEASLDDTLRGIREGHHPSFVERLRTKPMTGTLHQLFAHLEPWAMPGWKTLVVSTKGAWTALFSQGADVYQLSVAAGALGCRHVETGFSPSVVRGGRVVQYGYAKLALTHGKTVARMLLAHQDDRWKWDVQGDALPFEETSAYRERVIAKRLDLARLNRYCAALGIRRNDASWYGPQAVLIERRNPKEGGRTMSAAEWLARHR